MPKPRPLAGLLTTLILCAALAWLLGTGCGRQKGEVLARVNQTPITQRDLWEALETSENGELGRQTLDALITRALVRQEAQKRNVDLTQEQIELRLEGLKDYLLAGTGKDLDAWLADTGQTREEMLDRLSMQMLTARLVLTEDAVEQYFEENKERLEDLPHNNESIIFREIVVASEEEAQAVRNELMAGAVDGKVTGEQFAAVAEERTLDFAARRRGGMAGWLVKGKSSNPEIEKVVFELEPGEVSEPILQPAPQAPEGEVPEGQPAQRFWYVLMVEKHSTAQEITLERNRDWIEEWMLAEPQYQFELSQFVSNLKAKSDIQILSPRYRVLDEVYRESREARQRRLAQPTELAPVMPALPEGIEPQPEGAPPAREAPQAEESE